MTLQLQSHHLQAIRTHAAATYPHECCGILLGEMSVEAAKLVVEVHPTENVWRPEQEQQFATVTGLTRSNRGKQDSFTIDPQALLKIQKEARARDLQILGFYHSHPDHPATPSEFDRAIAWPEYSYLIITVPQGKPGELLSWQLDTQGQFQPEVMEITA
ncbi:MAG: M67 family metallopeptidase [Kamptonema sp. SIO4C4]|nr:M67 family metallopeptidase [Kamptonema sp. SIO4C4]